MDESDSEFQNVIIQSVPLKITKGYNFTMYLSEMTVLDDIAIQCFIFLLLLLPDIHLVKVIRFHGDVATLLRYT